MATAVAFAIQGCASNPGNHYIYFPDLASRAMPGDVAALREVLNKTESVSPGEQMEELAEILSKSVRTHPFEFLQAQSNEEHCFGVDYMGPEYADNYPAVRREHELRRKALDSISDPSLASVKQRCLAELDGS